MLQQLPPKSNRSSFIHDFFHNYHQSSPHQKFKKWNIWKCHKTQKKNTPTNLTTLIIFSKNDVPANLFHQISTLGVSKNEGTPKSPLFHRVFQYFHHPPRVWIDVPIVLLLLRSKVNDPKLQSVTARGWRLRFRPRKPRAFPKPVRFGWNLISLHKNLGFTKKKRETTMSFSGHVFIGVINSFLV